MTDHRFIFLDEDSRDLLEFDVVAHMSYIDMLSLLHDLLVPFSVDSERARFSTGEIFRELADLVHTFSSESQIGIAARENIKAAESLHSELGRNYAKGQPAQTPKLQGDLELFIADLLKEYDAIRIIRSRGGVARAK